MNDEQWHAIVHNDASYDGKFYYGVITTRIYCRPSCKSRAPTRDNVRIFANFEQALAQNFRPCKRCKPDGGRLPNEEWVAEIMRFIETKYGEPLTLAKLAQIFHGSPYHLQRTFKQVTGITPAEYLLQTRIAKAKALFAVKDRTVVEVAHAVGIPSAAHFSTVFLRRTGVSPSNYRNQIDERVEEA